MRRAFLDQVQVNNDEVQAYYDQHKDALREPDRCVSSTCRTRADNSATRSR